LEFYSDWQWEVFHESYCHSKIIFSEISGLVHSVRSALKAFELYPATCIMDTVFTEANSVLQNSQTSRDALKL
jgi:hypothetical protein